MIGRRLVLALAAVEFTSIVQLASLANANAATLDAPPPGIAPVSISLKDVLAAFVRSNGRPARGTEVRARSWTIAAFGLAGTSSQIADGDDDRTTITLGPFTESRGAYGGKRWRQNANGLTVAVTGVHQRDAVDDRALDQAERTGQAAGVALLGETKSPVDAYVVQVDPLGGRREWLYFEAASGRLVRKEAIVVDRRVVTTFDDFRTTDGITQAWHYRMDDGRPANVEDWHQTTERAMPPAAATQLVPPAGRGSIVGFGAATGPVRLPARLINGKIVVRVDVANRGLDFLLDSGASNIVFDERLVKALGLSTYGRSVRSTAGSYQESAALVPEMQVGELTMRSVAVTSLPFENRPANGTMVVGLLGFDFLDSVVLRIDYEHGTLDAFPASNPPQIPPTAVELPAALDDGVPDVRAKVGGTQADHFILDTGATSGVIFSSFADAHADAVRDRGLGTQLLNAHPFQFAGGVGGTLHVTPTQVASFGVADSQFENFLAYIVRGNRSYEGEDEDGLLGYDYLKYFTVYLDYRRERVLLVRNSVPYQPLSLAPVERVLP